MKRILTLILIFSPLSAFGNDSKVEPCSKLGGKLKVTTRMEGDKKNEEEKLCFFGKTAVMDKTIRKEFWGEKTILLNELAKSDFQKNIRNIKKQKFDPMNRENSAVRNCRLHGGTILRLQDSNGTDFQMCRFSDYSGMDADDFLLGRKDLGNIRVLKIRNPRKK